MNKKLLSGIIIGAVTGYVVGVLTAPKSGVEARKELEYNIKKSQNELNYNLNKLKLKLNSEFSKTGEYIRETSNIVVDKARHNGEQIFSKITNSTSNPAYVKSYQVEEED